MTRLGYTFHDDHGVMKVANLSLDETELENVIFIDEDNNTGEDWRAK